MNVPDYYSANDPLLSYTTRLHPMETHTTTRQPIDTTSCNEQTSEDNDVKHTMEIKTEILSGLADNTIIGKYGLCENYSL